LDLLSFHGYSNNPEFYRHMIESMRAKLAKYPSLAHVRTFIDQWNIDLFRPNLNPYFQPAFVMETTRVFYETGLDGSAFFHIRDYFVDEAKFSPFLSAPGVANMARWWNEMPQYEGIYDNQDRVRPDYYAFKFLSLIRGQKLSVTGTGPDIHAFAARGGHWVNALLWNFPKGGEEKPHEVTVRFPFEKDGQIRIVRLNAEAPVNYLDQVRTANVSDLQTHPVRIHMRAYEIYWVEITESK